MALPLFLRRFVYDAVQGAIAGVILLNLGIPGTFDETGAAAVVGASLVIRVAIAAVATAATGAVPGFLTWLSGQLGLEAPEA